MDSAKVIFFPLLKNVKHLFMVFSHTVLLKGTKFSPIQVVQNVDQKKRDSILFMFTLEVYLKVDPFLFLVHFSSYVVSVLFLFTL